LASVSSLHVAKTLFFPVTFAAELDLAVLLASNASTRQGDEPCLPRSCFGKRTLFATGVTDYAETLIIF
jgi:hypothetical protein